MQRLASLIASIQTNYAKVNNYLVQDNFKST